MTDDLVNMRGFSATAIRAVFTGIFVLWQTALLSLS